MRLLSVFLGFSFLLSSPCFAQMDEETLKLHQAGMAEHDRQIKSMNLNALMEEYNNKVLDEMDENGDGTLGKGELAKSGLSPSSATKAIKNIEDVAKGKEVEDSSATKTEQPLTAIPALGSEPAK